MTSCNSNFTDSPEKLSLPTNKIILISLNVLTAVFHIGGIVLLVRLRSDLNQIHIIINLAIMEMIASLKIPVLSSVSKVLRIPYMGMAVFCDLGIRLIMLMLLGDRFLEIF